MAIDACGSDSIANAQQFRVTPPVAEPIKVLSERKTITLDLQREWKQISFLSRGKG